MIDEHLTHALELRVGVRDYVDQRARGGIAGELDTKPRRHLRDTSAQSPRILLSISLKEQLLPCFIEKFRVAEGVK
jgi:hypothetical protein